MDPSRTTYAAAVRASRRPRPGRSAPVPWPTSRDDVLAVAALLEKPAWAASRVDRPVPVRRGPRGPARLPAGQSGDRRRPLIAAGPGGRALVEQYRVAQCRGTARCGGAARQRRHGRRAHRRRGRAVPLRPVGRRRPRPRGRARFVDDPRRTALPPGPPAPRRQGAPVTIRLVDVALRGFGGRSFSAGLTRLVELAADRREREIAYVTVARTMSEEQQNQLSEQLSAIYGRTVDLKISVSPDILGGLRVRIGDDLYDATILRHLAEARAGLAGRRP